MKCRKTKRAQKDEKKPSAFSVLVLVTFECGTFLSHFQAHNEKHVFFSLHAIGVSRHVGSYHVHKQ